MTDMAARAREYVEWMFSFHPDEPCGEHQMRHRLTALLSRTAREAAEEEREACAKVAERVENAELLMENDYATGFRRAANTIVASIRALAPGVGEGFEEKP